MEYLSFGLLSSNVSRSAEEDRALVTSLRQILLERANSSDSPNCSDHPAYKTNAMLSDSDCLRFLGARNYNAAAGATMAEAWYVWHTTPLPGQSESPSTILELPDKNEHLYAEHTPNSNLSIAFNGTPVYWEKTGIASARFGILKEVLSDDDIIARHVRQQEMMLYRMRYLTEKNRVDHARKLSLMADPVENHKDVKAAGLLPMRAPSPLSFPSPPPTSSPSDNNDKLQPPLVVEKQIIIMDMNNLVYALDVRAVSCFQTIAQMDEKYYPERLQNLFIINAPWFFQVSLNCRSSDPCVNFN